MVIMLEMTPANMVTLAFSSKPKRAPARNIHHESHDVSHIKSKSLWISSYKTVTFLLSLEPK